MKKNVWIFGSIAGTIIALFMVISISVCYQRENFEGNMFIGFAAMIAAFSFVYVGIKNYRDKYNGGMISFGEAFKVGLYISLIASTIYTAVWLVDYYVFIPDFMDKYTASVLQQQTATGADSVAIAAKAKEMASYREMYKNPLMVILLTYSEILPVGLIITLISAALLKRREKMFSPQPN